MLKTETKTLYKAFGLSVTSDIFLPELPVLEEAATSSDIEISIGELSKLWSELSSENNAFVIKKEFIMVHVPKVAIFSIRDGSKITVSPLGEYDEDLVRLYLLGTCMGAALIQRKVLPLHGSAIAIDGKAYAIIGDSGAGKSTLASEFLNRGYQLLSDDVIAVTMDGHIPLVTPAYPQQKLWDESLSIFGLESSKYRSVFGRENKYCVPVTSSYISDPLPLAGIIELVKTEEKDMTFQRVEKLERLQTLFLHTYRNFLIYPLGLMDWHFNMTVNIINTLDIFQLQRPNKGYSPDFIASLILKSIKGEK
ncbi:HPr kinase/phosphorylase [Peribacillus kribbensis]|uniref:HPr kinase/phosphorylase n=1 Tax=Peribacillus kribbensis TaxID=356658 RepID=UPI00041D8A14|nr:aldolase [Peribacillus kribbensis]